MVPEDRQVVVTLFFFQTRKINAFLLKTTCEAHESPRQNPASSIKAVIILPESRWIMMVLFLQKKKKKLGKVLFFQKFSVRLWKERIKKKKLPSQFLLEGYLGGAFV